MAHRSRGCLRCRQRRVKCDQGRPSCQRCVTRSELCVGYRDELDLYFIDQTRKVTQENQTTPARNNQSALYSLPRKLHARNKSVESLDKASVIFNPGLNQGLPWSKSENDNPQIGDNVVTDFFQRYVLIPCNESSCPGFLEHLPSLFKETNVNGRLALRWSVEANALADYSSYGQDDGSGNKALEYYGRSLVALAKSLSSDKDKVPDDYDLMTVVMLDLFETIFLPEDTHLGHHAQGMAHILRLRGREQFHDPRGWGLFRLAHHRLQKERLAKRLGPLGESRGWLDNLNSEMTFVELEKGALNVNTVCDKARTILSKLNTMSSECSSQETLQLVREMMQVDQQVSQWRDRSEWAYKTVPRNQIRTCRGTPCFLPGVIEIHKDIWMAYEWNYHRTARIILHQTLLDCLKQLSTSSILHPSEHELSTYSQISESTIVTLADSILSSVPQSLGDVDSLAQCSHDANRPRCQAIGAYLLLWPIKVIKSGESMVTESQKQEAQRVFERIRDITGMRSELGGLSSI